MAPTMDARESSVSFGGLDGRWVLALAALLLLLPALGSVGLSAPDEPRTAAVAREMFSMEHGRSGLALLHLNGEAYTPKPPLYYWMASVVSLLPGRVTEWSARLPSALAGLVNPVVAVIAMLLSSLTVVGNSARIAGQARGENGSEG